MWWWPPFCTDLALFYTVIETHQKVGFLSICLIGCQCLNSPANKPNGSVIDGGPLSPQIYNVTVDNQTNLPLPALPLHSCRHHSGVPRAQGTTSPAPLHHPHFKGYLLTYFYDGVVSVNFYARKCEVYFVDDFFKPSSNWSSFSNSCPAFLIMETKKRCEERAKYGRKFTDSARGCFCVVSIVRISSADSSKDFWRKYFHYTGFYTVFFLRFESHRIRSYRCPARVSFGGRGSRREPWLF